ncbi:hypothetical protein [Coleofasciculus sp. G2-EDA-02]|uniref:hypothetical protein n=1 Tax=Coleofasciculus sp. G2-EDA-02 TaxID=3069529 RepID=UPI00330200AB
MPLTSCFTLVVTALNQSTGLKLGVTHPLYLYNPSVAFLNFKHNTTDQRRAIPQKESGIDPAIATVPYSSTFSYNSGYT